MPLIDVIDAKDLEGLAQITRALVDNIKTALQEVRDETSIKISITFERKQS
jgi:hypothetical protein